MTEKKSLRVAYGEALTEIAGTDDRVVVFDSDLAHATMTSLFAKEYPSRFFNYGIAECNMIGAATGFAHAGFIPFVSTFALFGTGRAYEIIRNSVSYVGANVKFGLSHSGLSVGEDGGSHQSIEDLALMRVLPGMTILVPCDPIEMNKAVKAALRIKGPVYIRVARPVCECVTEASTPFEPGTANVMRDGGDVAIFSCGLMIHEALRAAELLEREGVRAAVVNFHTLKPFDEKTALRYARKCGAVVTAEEHSVIGGLGSATAEALMGKCEAGFARIGIEDKFGKSGKPDALFAAYGLTAGNIASACRRLLRKG